MVLNSKPFSIFCHIYIVRCCVLLALISTKFTNCNIISITRLPNQDDSFDVVSQQGLLCPAKACSKYNADQKLSGISDSCLCQCTSPQNTFYTKTYSCTASKDVVDESGCNIRIKDYKHESLPVIDILSTPGSLRLENAMHGTCSSIKTSWFYLKNGTWYKGKNGMLSATIKQHWTKPDMWFLNWHSGLHSNYSGIIIKVAVTCEHDNILDDNDEGCLMFKSQGTFKVNQTDIIPTKIPHISTTATPETSQPTIRTESSTEYKPSTQTTTPATQKQIMPTTPPAQTTTIIPDKEPRKETSTGDKKLWIAFAAGGVTIFFVMVGSLIFFILLCRQRKKQTARAGQSSTRTENANDPLHDYEYVVYPVLNEGHQSSSSLDNAMYGRGPDNELIIRTPGISMESLATNSINRNREGYNHGNKRSSSAYYPRDRDTAPLNHIINMNNTIAGNSSHEYAQLQRKQEDAIDSSSGIYQPLIRPATPEINDNRPDKNQAISLEPITMNTTPDYMVLETDDSCEKDLSA